MADGREQQEESSTERPGNVARVQQARNGHARDSGQTVVPGSYKAGRTASVPGEICPESRTIKIGVYDHDVFVVVDEPSGDEAGRLSFKV